MKKNTELYLQIMCIVIVLVLAAVLCDLQPQAVIPDSFAPSKQLGDCQACKLFIESFKNGLERTSRGKHEGGDAAWEEEKLKVSYKRSEMRLIDIQDSVCTKEKEYSLACFAMAEKAEEFIEEWWTQNPDSPDDLYHFICIEKLSVCCPKHHFGPTCSPCSSDHSEICSGNGKCRGNGTRKGNGTCLCNDGYTGNNCDQCSFGYFNDGNDGKKRCSKCHQSCKGCINGTQKDCDVCNDGFVFDTDEGCTDINECDEENKCKEDEFCLNSLGSYMCMKCDKACKKCYGYGPDMCRKCAEGYTKEGEFCISERSDDFYNQHLTKSRFMMYIGLLVATGILLPISTKLGSIIGFIVLSYIITAEYYCMLNGHDGLIKLKDFNLMPFMEQNI